MAPTDPAAGPPAKAPKPEAEPAPELQLSGGQVVLFTAVAVVLGLLLVCGLFEVGLRLAGTRPTYLDPAMYAPTGDPRGYALVPGWHGLYAGAEVHLGPFGLRGLRGEPPPGSVLLVGDSALFGQGVEDDQNLSAQLARLGGQAGDHRAVLNAGVPGYTTPLELEQLKLYLPRLRPSQVALIYVVDNDTDLRPGVWLNPDGTLDLHLSQTPGARLKRLFSTHLSLYAPLRGLVVRSGTNDPQEPALDAAAFTPQDLGWQRSQQALLAMRDLLKQAGVPFMVAGIGMIGRLQGLDVVSAFCAQQGIPYRTLWRTADVREYVQRYAVSRVDSHANPRANAEMARALHDAISQATR